MPFLSETFHMRKLAESAVNIKTTYITDGKLADRNTDGTKNEDVINGIRCRKEYYVRGKLAHIEKLFDSRIEYTYVSEDMNETPHTCSNCGFSGVIGDFADGCPYCKAAYNIDYTDKDLGSKYHYDFVLKKPLYRIVTAIVDCIISFILSYIFIVNTSRTFNPYDVSKIFIYGVILALVLYYLFYICDAYVVLGPIRRYKERQNKKQMEFWSRTGIDKKKFFNNLNYEVYRKYYSQPGIIDFDIIDYTDFYEYERAGVMCVDVSLEVRLVYLKNNRVSSKYKKDIITLMKADNSMKLAPGLNIIKCPKCNANIDATEGVCTYCGTKVGYIQEWIIQ